jgi:hypothetical protein
MPEPGTIAAIIQITIAAAQAVLAILDDLERAGDNKELAKTIIGAISKAIEQSNAKLVEVMRQQRLDELAGDVDGLFVTFSRYAADPEAVGNPERLVNLIDNLAKLERQMNRIVGRISDDKTTALAVFPAYANAVALTTVAVSERKHRFGVNEPLGDNLLKDARKNTNLILNEFREQNEARFRFTVKRLDFETLLVGFTFEGKFEEVAEIPDRGNVRAARDEVRRVIRERADAAFSEFPGVKEIQSFLAELDVAQDLSLFIAAATTRPQPLLKDVIELPAEANLRRFTLA